VEAGGDHITQLAGREEGGAHITPIAGGGEGKVNITQAAKGGRVGITSPRLKEEKVGVTSTK
jgi:hypothetical protein